MMPARRKAHCSARRQLKACLLVGGCADVVDLGLVDLARERLPLAIVK
jgi:hypothetical protein